jgi:hypothetical protein
MEFSSWVCLLCGTNINKGGKPHWGIDDFKFHSCSPNWDIEFHQRNNHNNTFLELIFFKSWVVVGWLVINVFLKVKIVNEMEMEMQMQLEMEIGNDYPYPTRGSHKKTNFHICLEHNFPHN